jgi:Tfp pilus assembly protein PilN
MKAVNLIPDDLRSATSGAPARTGIGVYAVLGVLGALVVLTVTWAVLERSAASKKAEIAEVRIEADALEARAGALEPYTRFAEIRRKRTETVTSLERNRFNWPHAIREISRVTPANVTFTQMKGTVAPGVNVPDASIPDTGQLRGALTVPAVEIEGCSVSQSEVAKYMTELRRIDGVTRVALAASQKTDVAASPGAGAKQGGASTGGGTGDTDCRLGDSKRPKFGMVVFFERSTATASTTDNGAAAPAAAAPANDASKGTQK